MPHRKTDDSISSRKTDPTPLKEAGYIQRLYDELEECRTIMRTGENHWAVADDVVRATVRALEIKEQLRSLGERV
jgi:hypothetical protein